MPPVQVTGEGADPSCKVTTIDHCHFHAGPRQRRRSHGPVDAGTHYKGIQLGPIEGGEGGFPLGR